MHVCMHSPTVYPLAISGVGNVVTHLARELDGLGVELSLVFYVDKKRHLDTETLSKLLGVSRNVHLYPILVPKLWRYRRGVLDLTAKVLKTHLNVRPDLVHIHCFPSISDGSFIVPYLAKFMRKPLVLTYHGSLTQEVCCVDNVWKTSLALSEWIRLSYFSLTKNLFDVTITSSKAMLQRMMGEGFQSQRINVIKLGVDAEHYSSMSPTTLEGEPALLFVGYTSWIKGSDILIESFEKVTQELPDAILHIVGHYDNRFLESLKSRSLLRKVRLHGPVHPNRVASYYKGADICIVSSRFEPFGLTTLEAMASGKPIVATRVGGLPETITNNVNGILVNPKADSIAKAIIELWKDADLMRKLSENSLKKSVEFNWKKVAKQYKAIYESILKDMF